jgi:prepilin-type N-terminal cleavage/methylation domain-containing protein
MFSVPNARHRAEGHDRAFTILEILVAMSVLALLLLLLLGVVDGASLVWKNKQSSADATREARAALHVMAADAKTLLRSPEATAVHLPGGTGGRLAILTLQPKGAQRSGNRSDLCTVGYFVAYDGPSRFTPLEQSSRNLYRYLRGSDETFSCLQAGEDVFADFETVAAMADPASHRNVALLARNVNQVDFESLKLSASGEPEPAGTSAPEAIGVRVSLVPTSVAARLKDEDAWRALPDEKEIASSTLIPTPLSP